MKKAFQSWCASSYFKLISYLICSNYSPKFILLHDCFSFWKKFLFVQYQSILNLLLIKIIIVAVIAVFRTAKGGSDTSGFSKFEVKKKRQQTDRVSSVRSIFRKSVSQAGRYSLSSCRTTEFDKKLLCDIAKPSNCLHHLLIPSWPWDTELAIRLHTGAISYLAPFTTN